MAHVSDHVVLNTKATADFPLVFIEGRWLLEQVWIPGRYLGATYVALLPGWFLLVKHLFYTHYVCVCTFCHLGF